MSGNENNLNMCRDEFMEMVGKQYDRAKLSKGKAQRLNEDPDFFIGLRRLIREHSVTGRYLNLGRKAKSEFVYPPDYNPRTEDLDRQIALLRDFFPGLGDCNQDFLNKVKSGRIILPENAEKFFAIPNWRKLPKIFGKTYYKALKKILEALDSTAGGHNKGLLVNIDYRRQNLRYLRPSKRTLMFLEKFSETQGCPDILIVPAQFGIRHPIKSGVHTIFSPRRIVNTFSCNEFGLGSFEVGAMLLANPERKPTESNKLYAVGIGDEYLAYAEDARIYLNFEVYYYAGVFKNRVISPYGLTFELTQYEDLNNHNASVTGFSYWSNRELVLGY